MNKTVKVYRLGEEPEDYSWALRYTDVERINIAETLTRELWTTSHGQPFPTMDRTAVRLSVPVVRGV